MSPPAAPLPELADDLLAPVRTEQAWVHMTRTRRRVRQLWPAPEQPPRSARPQTTAIAALTDGHRIVHVVPPGFGSAAVSAGWSLARGALPDGPELAALPRYIHQDLPWQPETAPGTWLVDSPEWIDVAAKLTGHARDLLAAGQQLHQVVVSEEWQEGAFTSTMGGVRSWADRRLEVHTVLAAGTDRASSVQSGPRLDASAVAAGVRQAGIALAAATAPERPAPRDRALFLPAALAELLRLMTAAAVRGAQGPVTRSASCRLVDDARAAGAPWSAPVDQEGTPTGRTTIMDVNGEVGALRTRLARTAGRDAGGLTGHARRLPWHTAPAPTPANVLLEPAVPAAGRADVYDGPVVISLRGAGTQVLRSGAGFTVQLLGAVVADGRVTGRWGPVTISMTPREVLERVEWVAGADLYQTGEAANLYQAGEVATAAQSAVISVGADGEHPAAFREDT